MIDNHEHDEKINKGLFTRKIMALEDIHILHVHKDGLLHYALSHKQNKYGKALPSVSRLAPTAKARYGRSYLKTKF